MKLSLELKLLLKMVAFFGGFYFGMFLKFTVRPVGRCITLFNRLL
jgi:hypothetical protein